MAKSRYRIDSSKLSVGDLLGLYRAIASKDHIMVALITLECAEKAGVNLDDVNISEALDVSQAVADKVLEMFSPGAFVLGRAPIANEGSKDD